MITIISNLFALLPINYAFIVQKNYILGNMYLVLLFVSTARHSLCETWTPQKDLYSKISDLGTIYISCCYLVYKRWILIFPYACMFLLHRWYLTPHFDNYKIKQKIIHAFGLHLAGALIALTV